MGLRAATMTITVLFLLNPGRAAGLEPCQTDGTALLELSVEQGQLVVRQTLHLVKRSADVKPSELRQHGLLAEQLVSAELLLFDRATSADEVLNDRVKPSRRVDLGDATTYERVTRVLRVAGDPAAVLLGGDAPSRALRLTYLARADRLTAATARFRVSLGLPVAVSQKVGDGVRHAPLFCGPDRIHVRLRLDLPPGVTGQQVSAFSNHEIGGEPIVTDATWGLDEVIELGADPPLAIWIALPREAVSEAQEDPFGVALLRFLYGERSYAGVAPRIALSLLILIGLVWARGRGGGSRVGSYVLARVLVGNLALLAPLWLRQLGLVHVQRFGFIEGTIVYGTWAIDALYLIPVFLAAMRRTPERERPGPERERPGPERERREPELKLARVEEPPPRPVPLSAPEEEPGAPWPASASTGDETGEDRADEAPVGGWSVPAADDAGAAGSDTPLEGLWDDSPDIGPDPKEDEERR